MLKYYKIKKSEYGKADADPDYTIDREFRQQSNITKIGKRILDQNGLMGSVEDIKAIYILEVAAAPTAKTNYGALYTKADNKLYFQDGAGNSHEIDYA